MSPINPAKARQTMQEAILAAQTKARETALSQSFFSTDAKQRLVSDHVELYAHSFTRRESQFGPQWDVVLSEDSPNNPKATASFGCNVYRDELFAGYQAIIHTIKQPLGPLELGQKPTKGGMSYDLRLWTTGDDDMGQLDFLDK